MRLRAGAAQPTLLTTQMTIPSYVNIPNLDKSIPILLLKAVHPESSDVKPFEDSIPMAEQLQGQSWSHWKQSRWEAGAQLQLRRDFLV
ncbi:SHC-transforming protein 1 [Microtus ochrogaster]|uniref:SHC-transforming protein 1 n=1 Tax=Microtus ochrogaster TaxID=79684 RepID=A0A8J6GJU9_MICOH|nr:SHC-transforming protein 1 [Microtus ochrogaster]